MENALITLNGQPIDGDYGTEDDVFEPYCYVCRRCTDHVAEHDDLVDVGLAEYVRGEVRWTPASTFEAIEAWRAVDAFLSVLFGIGWYYDSLDFSE
jgi:hypothetical protein